MPLAQQWGSYCWVKNVLDETDVGNTYSMPRHVEYIWGQKKITGIYYNNSQLHIPPHWVLWSIGPVSFAPGEKGCWWRRGDSLSQTSPCPRLVAPYQHTPGCKYTQCQPVTPYWIISSCASTFLFVCILLHGPLTATCIIFRANHMVVG